jgi:hypothetical protein
MSPWEATLARQHITPTMDLSKLGRTALPTTATNTIIRVRDVLEVVRMSVSELVRSDRGVLREVSAGSRQAAQPEPVELSDEQLARLFKRGFVFGTPVLYLVVVSVFMLAARGHWWLLLAAAWPTLFAGWYFGGLVALTVHELRWERRQRQSVTAPMRPVMRRTRPVTAH